MSTIQPAVVTSYTVAAVDYSPGTGISVTVHRAGCHCRSVEEAIYRSPYWGTFDGVHRIARRTAAAFQLNADDYSWSDCAL